MFILQTFISESHWLNFLQRIHFMSAYRIVQKWLLLSTTNYDMNQNRSNKSVHPCFPNQHPLQPSYLKCFSTLSNHSWPLPIHIDASFPFFPSLSIYLRVSQTGFLWWITLFSSMLLSAVTGGMGEQQISSTSSISLWVCVCVCLPASPALWMDGWLSVWMLAAHKLVLTALFVAECAVGVQFKCD